MSQPFPGVKPFLLFFFFFTFFQISIRGKNPSIQQATVDNNSAGAHWIDLRDLMCLFYSGTK